MIGLAALSLLVQAAVPPPGQASTSPAGEAAPRPHLAVQFLFYRLQYYHDRAAQQDCVRAHPERTRALDSRYDAAEQRVSDLAGAEAVARRSSTDARVDDFDGNCRFGVILTGYDNALQELERHLAGKAP